MPLRLYDPESPSSSSQIYCSSKVCRTTVGLTTQPIGSSCAILDAKCDYKVGYGDGTSLLGYLRSDVLHFNTIAPGSPTFSTTAVFGCNYHLSGRLAKSDTAVDGLLGLGRGFYSLVSQLSSVGIAPVFAHCLRGGKNGGGILVFGEIMDPSLVYSPLVSAGDMYNLNLQTISMDGKIVDIDPAVFSLKNGTGGTIVDSGTGLSKLPEEAYFHSLKAAVSQSAEPIGTEEGLCFEVSGRIDDIFPLVNFNFEGGTSMVVKPKDYLLWQLDLGRAEMWCIGFEKQVGQRITILGELVLKDKIVVYDLAHQRLGWADHDCSKPVNVSSANNKCAQTPPEFC